MGPVPMLGLPAGARLTAPPPWCLLQELHLSNNNLTGTISWTWVLPDSLTVSVLLQQRRACMCTRGQWGAHICS